MVGMFDLYPELASQAIEDTFRRDRVSIYPARTASKGTMAPDFTVTYDDATARCLHEPAHLEPMVGRRQDEQGGAVVTVGEIACKIRSHVASNVRPGDEVRVDESREPLLRGAVLIVLRAEPRTMGLSTRIICRRPKASSAPGAP